MPTQPAPRNPFEHITTDVLAADIWAQRDEGPWPPANILQAVGYRSYAEMVLAELVAADERQARA